MNEKKASLTKPFDNRAPYEPPGIEQSAHFEQLMLSCSMTGPDHEPDPCGGAFLSVPDMGGGGG